jgi:hypothetical protein
MKQEELKIIRTSDGVLFATRENGDHIPCQTVLTLTNDCVHKDVVVIEVLLKCTIQSKNLKIIDTHLKSNEISQSENWFKNITD